MLLSSLLCVMQFSVLRQLVDMSHNSPETYGFIIRRRRFAILNEVIALMQVQTSVYVLESTESRIYDNNVL